MTHTSKKVSILIFLIALFVLLAVLTGSWLYKIYIGHTNFTDKESSHIFECSGRIFKISQVAYGDGLLNFTITNTYGEPFDTLIVRSENITKEVELYDLIEGSSQDIGVEIFINGSVDLFSKGCEEYDKKTYSVN